MTDPWWLKFKRAQHHMVDIRREARRYARAHPYRTVPIRQPQHYDGVQRFRLEITEQPDPAIAIILGDFIHNLRSALDHVVVAATSPRSKRGDAGFPIATENPWATDANGKYVFRDPQRRKSIWKAINGVPLLAQAVIIGAQPYRVPDPEKDVLAVLNRLENADKHRELITIGSGLVWPRIIVVRPDDTLVSPPLGYGYGQFVPDGAEIHLTVPLPTNTRVKMEFSGTPAVSIKVTPGGHNQPPIEFRLCESMATALRNVRTLLRGLEPFAIRDRRSHRASR